MSMVRNPGLWWIEDVRVKHIAHSGPFHATDLSLWGQLFSLNYFRWIGSNLFQNEWHKFLLVSDRPRAALLWLYRCKVVSNLFFQVPFHLKDIEVTTNLKIAPCLVCDGRSSLTLPIVFKPEVKRAFSTVLFVSNSIAIWDAITVGDREQLRRMWYHTFPSLSGRTSSFSVGFFSKQHNEIIPLPSKMES